MFLHPYVILFTGGASVSLWGGSLCPGGVSVQGESLSRGTLSRAWTGTLSRGSLCWGVSVQECLCLGGYLFRKVFFQGVVCPGESVTRGVSVWGVSAQGGVSVQGVSVQGGLCPRGGLSPGVSLSRGLSVTETPHTVIYGQYAFYWNAFLLFGSKNTWVTV